jgi:hypothetical protein
MNRKEQLIQGYFKEALDTQDLVTMQQLLETDTIFKEESDFYQDLQIIINEYEREKLHYRLEDIENSSEKLLLKKVLPFAFISIAISLATLFLVFSGGLDSQELYTQYFEAYPATLNEINSNIKSRDMQPFRAYERQDYVTAAQGFRTQFEMDAQPDLQFYYTMSLLNSGNNDAEVFQQLKNLEINNTKYQPQIYWYFGLHMLKEENVKEAKIQFNKLLNHPAKYKNREAKAILDALD